MSERRTQAKQQKRLNSGARGVVQRYQSCGMQDNKQYLFDLFTINRRRFFFFLFVFHFSQCRHRIVWSLCVRSEFWLCAPFLLITYMNFCHAPRNKIDSIKIKNEKYRNSKRKEESDANSNSNNRLRSRNCRIYERQAHTHVTLCNRNATYSAACVRLGENMSYCRTGIVKNLILMLDPNIMQILFAQNWFLMAIICLVIAFVINEYYICTLIGLWCWFLGRNSGHSQCMRRCGFVASTFIVHYIFFSFCRV